MAQQNRIQNVWHRKPQSRANQAHSLVGQPYNIQQRPSGALRHLQRRACTTAVASTPEASVQEASTSSLPELGSAVLKRWGPRSWNIRPIRKDDVLQVAQIQARSFFTASPLRLLNPLLFYMFQGEVVAGLHTKMKYKRDSFCCLVAEGPTGDPIGVVEISLQAEKEEMGILRSQGMEDEVGYAYVACMAVDPPFRRQGVASDLLAAAEARAGKWRQNWVLLHTYADNAEGLALYTKNGYVELKRDPEWVKRVGRRRRVLLARTASVGSLSSGLQSISTSLMQIWQQQQQQ